MGDVTSMVGTFPLTTDMGPIPVDGVRIGPFIIHDAVGVNASPGLTSLKAGRPRRPSAMKVSKGRYGITHAATGLAMVRCNSKHAAFAFCERIVGMANWSMPCAPDLGALRNAYVAAVREAEAAL